VCRSLTLTLPACAPALVSASQCSRITPGSVVPLELYLAVDAEDGQLESQRD
jgi:hypothetical protein